MRSRIKTHAAVCLPCFIFCVRDNLIVMSSLITHVSHALTDNAQLLSRNCLSADTMQISHPQKVCSLHLMLKFCLCTYSWVITIIPVFISMWALYTVWCLEPWSHTELYSKTQKKERKIKKKKHFVLKNAPGSSDPFETSSFLNN